MDSFCVAEVQKHNSANDCWLIIHDKVYNVTSWMNTHPGGKDVLLLMGGKDATQIVESYHVLSSLGDKLQSLCVGTLDSRKETSTPSKFYELVKERVDLYFEQNKLDPRASFYTWFNYSYVLLAMVVGYAVPLLSRTCRESWVLAFLCSLLLGIASALLCLLPLQDASDFNITDSPAVWKAVGLCHDFLHGGSYLASLHKRVSMLAKENEPVAANSVLKMAVTYPLMYGVTVMQRRIEDFAVLLKAKMTVGNVLVFFGAKTFFVLYRFVIPSLFMPFWKVVLLFVVSDLVTSYWLNVMERANKIKPAATVEEADWAIRLLKTTQDFAHDSRVMFFLSGGRSYQIIRGLFPSVSPSYYAQLFPIVQQVCREVGLQYTVRPSLCSALLNDAQHKKASAAPTNAGPEAVEPLHLIIDGRTYDATLFVKHHPGGVVIRSYAGLDATEVFRSFHSERAYRVLQALPSTAGGLERSAVITTVENDFKKLRSRLESEGLFKASFLWYTYKTISTLLWGVIAVALIRFEFYFISSLFMALCWQQLGWLAHEYAHHQVFENRIFNGLMGLFLGNVCLGFSVSWWKDRHNQHHAVPNVLGADPDIDNLPMLAWDKSDLDRAPDFVLRTIPYQKYYFLLILPLLRIVWCLQSVFFVLDMHNKNTTAYNKIQRAEIVTLVIHYGWVMATLAMLPDLKTVFMYAAISQLLSGFGIAIVVFFNHYSTEKHPKSEDLSTDFVRLQLLTTRNMNPGRLVDWLWGGLNYQVEHHLFPTMPRHNLKRASQHVMEFCKEHNIEYLCCDFMSGLKFVLRFLDGVSARVPEVVQERLSKKVV
eukprot:GILK01003240.1.p1 GENE.GILK01003240.1~~GILK01003240.1.p1  ORF type:complete len:821 (+),score=102.64 GILK01003240.1:58-2520(+)